MINHIISKLSSNTHLKELVKGSSIAFIFRILGMCFGYIFIFLIARWYGSEAVGSFSLSFTLLHIFTTIGVFGFDNSLIKFISDFNSNNKLDLVKEIYKKSLYITIPLGIILSVFLYYSANFFALVVFKNENLELFFQIAALAIPALIILRINATVFRGLKKIKLFSILQNVGIYLVSIVILLLARMNDVDSSITILSQCLAIGVLLIVSFIFLKRYSCIFQTISQNILRYNDILKVSFPMLLTSSMALIMGWADIIMLGVFRGEEDVGVYSVVVKLASLTSIALMAINTIAAPKFSELYSRGDMQGLKNVAQSSTKMIFYISLPIILLLLIFPKAILGIFGEEFILGSIALWILMVGQFVNAISGSVGYILNMTMLQNMNMKINFIAVLINIGLNYYLIPLYGIIGAALATAISISFQNISKAIYIYIKYNFLSFYLPKFSYGSRK